MNKKEVNVTLKWVLQNLNPWMILCLFIFGVTSSFEGVLNGYILGYIPRLNVKDGNSLIAFGIAAVLSYLTVYVSLFLFSLLMQKAIQTLNEKIKGIYFRANFASSFNNPNLDSSEVLNNMTSISKQIEEKYFEPLLLLFQSLMTVISSTVVVLMTNPVLGLIYLALSFMSLLPSYMGKEKMKIKTDMWSHSNSNFLAITRDLFAGRFEITNFGVKKLFMQKFDHSLHDEEQRYYQLNAFQYVLQFISWLFAILITLTPIFIGLWMAKNSILGVTVSTILTLTLTADHVVGGFRQLTNFETQIQSTEGIRKISWTETKTDQKIAQSVADNKLVVENLSVKRGDREIFKNLSLSLNENDKMIITGPSGIGKSTLLNAIAGYIPIEMGDVKFGGHKLKYSDFVFISQNIWLFAGTIRENLSLLQNFTDEELVASLKKVGLYKELGSKALDFEIKEQGKNLSGGQAQRLAVARGLLRHKKIFLLDEITSSLDHQNADEVHCLIYQLPSIVIEVAHNFNKKIAQENNVKIFNLAQNTK